MHRRTRNKTSAANFNLIVGLFALGQSGLCIAHDGHDGDDGVGFLTGLLHPALGFDHLLAMLSVGILSVQIGGRAIWYVPATFVLVMILGGVLGMVDVPLPGVEFGIALSVLILGIVIASDLRTPTWLAMIFVAFFAVFHGHAHGTEMPVIANPWLYSLGFVIGTALIHLSGVLIGFGSDKLQRGNVVLRSLGGVIALVGLYMVIS